VFPAATYIGRREVLVRTMRQGSAKGLLLFLGNRESPCNYEDNVYPFRQDSTFLYYFGIDRPGFAALIDLEEGRTTVFADDIDLETIVWTGPQPSVAELAAGAGVESRETVASLEERVARARAEGRRIHLLPPYRADNMLRLMGFFGSRDLPEASVTFIMAVVEQRAVKSPEELVAIEMGVDLSVDMHYAAMRMARPGIKESEIQARVTEIALAGGAGLAFPVIATTHGETLHMHSYANTLRSGDILLLDCGAEGLEHYGGDLSSSIPVDPTFTGRQRDIYTVVVAAHLAAVARVAPGVPMLDVHLTACRTIARGLKELGLMKGDPDAAVAAGAHALFFPCGTGHMLGLDTHDMEDLGELFVGYEGRPRNPQFGIKSLRLARPLKPGFVITVEPGIYFIPPLARSWKAEGRFAEFIDYAEVERWMGAGGMRIEENLAVGSDGARILGKFRPRTIEEVEAVRKG